MPKDKKNPLRTFTDFYDTSTGMNRIYDIAQSYGRLSTGIDIEGLNALTNRGSPLAFSDESTEKQLKLQDEIHDLKKQYRTTVAELQKANSNHEEARQQLDAIHNELKAKERINHILPRLCEKGRKKLLEDEGFRLQFDDASNCDAVVVSIDIRRSTELMLKARKPEMFSKFITDLSQKLSEAILVNFGVFDKFTGDGILAFFPRFYSGEHAIVRALKAAAECHEIFNDHYNQSRKCFNVFIKDVGLGIGIDYGTVTLVNTRNELTVVGIPVVYACRMGGAKAGQTLLNQPALEELDNVFAGRFKAIETEINIKNEGTALAYEVVLNDNLDLQAPKWLEGNVDEAENVKVSVEPQSEDQIAAKK